MKGDQIDPPPFPTGNTTLKEPSLIRVKSIGFSPIDKETTGRQKYFYSLIADHKGGRDC